MNCLDTQAWLQQRMDGLKIPTSESLERHWSECATCRGQCAAAQILLEGLKSLPRVQPSPGFAESLTARILEDRRHRQTRMRRRVFVTTALAASVLLLLFWGYTRAPRQMPDPIGPSPAFVEVVPPKTVPAPKKSRAEEKPEPRNAITSLTARWADTTRDHAKVVLVATNLDAVPNLPTVDVLPPMDPGIRDAGQDVSDGVRAVTQNARRAFNFFARELPMPDLDTKEN